VRDGGHAYVEGSNAAKKSTAGNVVNPSNSKEARPHAANPTSVHVSGASHFARPTVINATGSGDHAYAAPPLASTSTVSLEGVIPASPANPGLSLPGGVAAPHPLTSSAPHSFVKSAVAATASMPPLQLQGNSANRSSIAVGKNIVASSTEGGSSGSSSTSCHGGAGSRTRDPQRPRDPTAPTLHASKKQAPVVIAIRTDCTSTGSVNQQLRGYQTYFPAPVHAAGQPPRHAAPTPFQKQGSVGRSTSSSDVPHQRPEVRSYSLVTQPPHLVDRKIPDVEMEGGRVPGIMIDATRRRTLKGTESYSLPCNLASLAINVPLNNNQNFHGESLVASPYEVSNPDIAKHRLLNPVNGTIVMSPNSERNMSQAQTNGLSGTNQHLQAFMLQPALPSDGFLSDNPSKLMLLKDGKNY
jgi:hypothetical protein